MKLSALVGLLCIILVSHTTAYTTKAKQVLVDEHSITKNIFLHTAPADSTIDAVLNKLYKHGMPMLLSDAKSILGKTYKFTKATDPGDFDDYIWTTKDGLQYNFEDINYNEKGIELDRLTITSKQVVKHPLGIYLNQSNLAACKKTCAGLKKSVDERTYKFSKGKTWYFLEFNKQNLLIKIKSVGWDTDYSG